MSNLYELRKKPTSYSQTIQNQDASENAIAVIGLGYVGLPLAMLAAKKGHPVIGFDINAEKVGSIRRGDVSILTTEEQQKLKHLSTLSVSHHIQKIAHASTYIICVPTPVLPTQVPNLEPLKNATEIVAGVLKPHDLVVIESTVNPGVCEEIVIPILEQGGLKAEQDFYLAHCPERINPGDADWTVCSIPRVLGASGPESLIRAKALYQSIIDGEILEMKSLKEAEAVKMVENAFRDINIAFVNELAMSFDRAGIDLISVLQGASTKPFGFMRHLPGCGVGGHCIPVDPYYLIRFGQDNGFKHKFLITARNINNKMPSYSIHLLQKALGNKRKTLKNAHIALLGLSYKRDIADERESPAHEIKALLLKHKARVRIFDPFVPQGSNVASIEEALEGADAALIATDHTQFRMLTPLDFKRGSVDIVIDGRNCLDKEEFKKNGILYSGIGRSAV